MKTALITGANGQDAFYLTKFLLQKNYRIVLTTRRLISDFFTQFCIDLGDLSLKNNNTIIIESKDFEYKEIKNIITQYEISEIYNLGGHSNVVNSFKNPSLIIKDPLKNFETLTKIIIDLGSHIKLFQASSSEMFKDIGNGLLDENSKFNPLSPYANGKLKVHKKLIENRLKHDLYMVSGIMFNHESIRRSENYLFSHIAGNVGKIINGSKEKFRVSNLKTVRDWGYSPEFVEAMWKSLNTKDPDDYIISTGRSFSVQEILEYSFSIYNLDYEDFIYETYNENRKYDVLQKYSNPEKIYQKLSWKAKFNGKDIIRILIESKINND